MELNSQGVVFKQGTATLGEILSISGPNETAKQIDTTSLEDSSHVYIAGLKDGGEVTIEFNVDPSDAGQAALRAAFVARTTDSYTIDLTDATETLTVPTQYAFDAIVTAPPSLKIGVDSQITGSASLKVSGDVDVTVAHAAGG